MKYYKGFPIPEIGDKVKVRGDISYGKRYCHLHNAKQMNSVTSDMHQLAGQYVQIRAIVGDDSRYNGQYVIKELGGVCWVTDMFDLSEYMIKPIDVSKNDLMEFLI